MQGPLAFCPLQQDKNRGLGSTRISAPNASHFVANSDICTSEVDLRQNSEITQRALCLKNIVRILSNLTGQKVQVFLCPHHWVGSERLSGDIHPILTGATD
jgi:hypothetical protein